MEQRTAEWYEARKGRVTASAVGAVLGNSPFVTRNDAMRSMVRETLGAETEFTGNVATEYGVHHEPGAIIEYRMHTSYDVTPVGFVAYEDWAGASPDGLIGDNGGLEVKCPYGLRKEPAPVPFKPIDRLPHYHDQIQFSLFVTGRDWWDFWQWAPNGTRLERVRPSEEWRDYAIPRLRQFHAEYLDEIAAGGADHLGPKRPEFDTPEARGMVEAWDNINQQLENLSESKRQLLEHFINLAGGQNALIAGRKLTVIERSGSVAYAKVVKDHLSKLDLKPYRGKPTTYWRLS